PCEVKCHCTAQVSATGGSNPVPELFVIRELPVYSSGGEVSEDGRVDDTQPEAITDSPSEGGVPGTTSAEPDEQAAAQSTNEAVSQAEQTEAAGDNHEAIEETEQVTDDSSENTEETEHVADDGPGITEEQYLNKETVESMPDKSELEGDR